MGTNMMALPIAKLDDVVLSVIEGEVLDTAMQWPVAQ